MKTWKRRVPSALLFTLLVVATAGAALAAEAPASPSPAGDGHRFAQWLSDQEVQVPEAGRPAVEIGQAENDRQETISCCSGCYTESRCSDVLCFSGPNHRIQQRCCHPQFGCDPNWTTLTWCC